MESRRTEGVRSCRWAGCPLALLIVSLLASALLSSTPARAANLDELAPGGRAEAFTVGPEGDLWFGGLRQFGIQEPAGEEKAVGLIGQVQPSGRIVEYELPETAGSPIFGIAAGSDGALWFTESEYDAVGRITPSGEISQFPLPQPGSGPEGIVAGPDGALWFTEFGGDRVGRITTGGALTEFQLPAGSGPTGIAVGREGDLWVAEGRSKSIARLTPTGAIAHFPIPGAKARPYAIAAAGDGDLWFSEGSSEEIGRITPAGRIFQVPVPIGFVNSVAPRPDGKVWFGGPDGIGTVGVGGHATAACPNYCRFPVISLALDSNGALRYGTGTANVEGGGLSHQLAIGEPGAVATYEPGALRLRVSGRNAAAPAGNVALTVYCGGAIAGSRCRGTVELDAASKPTGTGAPISARRRVAVFSGESRVVHLALMPAIAAKLRRQGSLAVEAKLRIGGRRTTQEVTLKPKLKPQGR